MLCCVFALEFFAGVGTCDTSTIHGQKKFKRQSETHLPF